MKKTKIIKTIVVSRWVNKEKDGSYRKTPSILLRGKYLSRFGLEIGTTVALATNGKYLILVPIQIDGRSLSVESVQP